MSSSSWTAGYAKIATTVAAVPEDARDIAGALRILSGCLDPLLHGPEQYGS